MSLEVPLTLEPMEAEAVDELPPAGKGWQYEPKVDGFRCIIFRDGDQVHLQSRRQKPLERYFPEVAEATRTLEPTRFAPVSGQCKSSSYGARSIALSAVFTIG